MKAWAFIKPDGSILADTDFRDADHAWRIGLGWPDAEETEEAKKKGYRVEQVEIHPCASKPVDVNEKQNVSDKSPDYYRAQRDMLGEAIAQAAIKAGIVREGVDLDGPMLMMLCENLADIASHKAGGNA